MIGLAPGRTNDSLMARLVPSFQAMPAWKAYAPHHRNTDTMPDHDRVAAAGSNVTAADIVRADIAIPGALEETCCPQGNWP